jgi:hypothetical protein
MYPYFPTSFKYETLSNLNPGDFVVLYNDGANKLVVEKQVIDAFNLYFGFVTNSYTAGQVAEIYGLRVVNNQLVGLVPGDTYYAHPTNPGEVTNVLPIGTSVIQQVGVAINTTDLDTQYYNNYEGSGGGTVTSVALALPTEFTISGSPVTTTGTLTGTWANQTNNFVLAGPSVAPAGAPTFRALVAADIPSLSSIYQPLDSDLTTIAGLTPTTDNFIQSKAGAWASRTVAEVYTDLQPSVMDDLCMYSIVASGGFALGTGTGAQSAFATGGDVWTLAANTTYEFEWIIRITKSGTTCTLSAGFALGGGGSVTSVIINAIGGSGASGNAGVIWGYVNIGGGQVTVTSVTNALVTLKGLIRMNAGGTVTPQITFSASPTSPVMAAGSHIKFTKWNSDVTNTRGTVA